ncbi:MAG: FliM/FliN family flagellar motor switch protein [Balneolaceae bacterium]
MSTYQNPVAEDPSENKDDSSGKNIRLYDFKQPKLVSKEIIRAMRDIHDLYARHIKQIFSNVLNHSMEVVLLDVEQVVFSEYLNEIDPPTSIFLFNIEELGDWAVLQIQPGFCIYCVERQSGGYKIDLDEKRILTRIEEKIIGRVIDRSLNELSHVWSTYISFKIENYIYESKPSNIRTISANSPGIVIRFAFKFDDYKVPFSICYPYGMLKDNLLGGNTLNLGKSNTVESLTSQQQKNYENDIKQVPAELRVQLGESKVPLRELIQLNEGDLIMLNQQIEEPLQIVVNNRDMMNGYPGTLNGKKAVKIFNIKKNSNDPLD